jgi:hypothetical protein
MGLGQTTNGESYLGLDHLRYCFSIYSKKQQYQEVTNVPTFLLLQPILASELGYNFRGDV